MVGFQGVARFGTNATARGGRVARQRAPVPARKRRSNTAPAVGAQNGRTPTAVGMHGDTAGRGWFGAESGVKFYLDLALGNGPYHAAHRWEDWSTYLQSIIINRGRTDEYSDVGAGSMSVTIDNTALDTSRGFPVSNSPYDETVTLRSTNKRPLTPIRARVNVGSGGIKPLYSGFVQDIRDQWDLDTNVHNLEVDALDAFAVLARTPLSESAYAAVVAADKPLAYWQDQSPATLTVEDSTGNSNNHLAAVARTVAVQEAPIGGENANTYSTGAVGYGDAPTGAVPRTFEAWVQVPATKGDRAVFTWQLDANNWNQVQLAYRDDVSNSGNFMVIPGFSDAGAGPTPGRSNLVAQSTPGLAPGQWIHLVVSRNGVSVSGSADTTNIYINGAHVNGRIPTAGPAAIPLTPTAPISIEGYRDTAAALGFPVTCAHVAWYADSFSAAKALAHYEAGVHAYGHPYTDFSGARLGRILDDAGWPSIYRVLPTGLTPHQIGYRPEGGRALSAVRGVEAAEAGFAFVDAQNRVTLRDRQFLLYERASPSYAKVIGPASGIPINDVVLVKEAQQYRNVTDVAYDGGTVQARDQDQINLVGALDDAVSAPTVHKRYLALQRGRYHIRLHSGETNPAYYSTGNASTLRSLMINMRNLSAADRAAMLDVDLGWWLSMNQTTRYGGQLGQTLAVLAFVEGVRHVITKTTWTIGFYLRPRVSSEVYNQNPYLTVGHATYGQLGTAAGNKVPY